MTSCACIPLPEGTDPDKMAHVLQAHIFACVCACALRHRGLNIYIDLINFYVTLASLFNLLVP